MLPIQSIGSVHHITLIYPFPQIFLAAGIVAGAQSLGERFSMTLAATAAATVCVAVLTLVNLNSLLQQYDVMLRYGGSTRLVRSDLRTRWTISNQSSPGTLSPFSGAVFTQLRLLSKDRLHVGRKCPSHIAALRTRLTSWDSGYRGPNSLFVLLAADQPKIRFRKCAKIFHQTARRLGYEPRLKRAIADRQGRIVYEVFEVDLMDPNGAVTVRERSGAEPQSQ